MSDHSLMNPDHLKKEMYDLEHILIPQNEKLSNEIHVGIRRIFSYIEITYDKNEPTTLTPKQVTDMIETLSKIDTNRWRYTNAEQFAFDVYKHLQTDRRWQIASRLKFLKKN